MLNKSINTVIIYSCAATNKLHRTSIKRFFVDEHQSSAPPFRPPFHLPSLLFELDPPLNLHVKPHLALLSTSPVQPSHRLHREPPTPIAVSVIARIYHVLGLISHPCRHRSHGYHQICCPGPRSGSPLWRLLDLSQELDQAAAELSQEAGYFDQEPWQVSPPRQGYGREDRTES